jgi:hypothetical protein
VARVDEQERDGSRDRKRTRLYNSLSRKANIHNWVKLTHYETFECTYTFSH